MTLPTPANPAPPLDREEQFRNAVKAAALAYIEVLPHLQALQDEFVKAFVDFAVASAKCQKMLGEVRRSGALQ